MVKNLIFLDIDGVLNSTKHFERIFEAFERCKDILPNLRQFIHHKYLDYEAVDLLNKLIKETDAYIVISSTWRLGYSIKELDTILHDNGIEEGRVIGKTDRYYYAPGQVSYREEEIFRFIHEMTNNSYSKLESWVAIDDDIFDLHLIDDIGRLVKVDNDKGFSINDYEKALNILKNNKLR